MTVDTVLVDGVDLKSAARILKVWQGVHDAAPLRGDFPSVYGRDGVFDAQRPFGATPFSLGLKVRGGAPDVTGFNDRYRALKAIVKPDRLVTLTRRLSFATGNEDHTAPARYVSGLQPTQETPADYSLVIQWLLITGFWEGPATALAATPRGVITTVPVKGDVRTRNMTVTLSGSTGGAIAFRNDTNGAYFTYNGETASADVAINVLEQRATQGSTDVSEHLAWQGDTLFELNAGNNSVELYGGSAGSTIGVSYRPAWL